MPNRLARETSPYLLQHKDNPVDWYAWGDEAFAAARAADKPVLLSVGYSACHWCHVMAHESFEDEDIAALMNQGFVNIKVDREERPDVDAIYMQAVQAMTGRGGWPMTVFLTPEGVPFFGGTYFPPEDRPGMPGFPRLLNAIGEAYRSKRTDVENTGRQLLSHLSTTGQLRPGDALLTTELLDRAADALLESHDDDKGGFGRAPKFPNAMAIDFLLRSHKRTGRPAPLQAAELDLRLMARGGMYDQAGGGFHRYSTDDVWLVPHFEKMLYDNALLARVYVDAWKLTGNDFYRSVARETLDYVLREMTDPAGGFYSSQDADSEGEEGRFFLWTPAQLRQVLGEDAELVGRYFGVTDGGNFEGRNILNVPVPQERFAAERNLDAARFDNLIPAAKAKLYAAREARVHPGRDDKVLTAWNGLMLRAFSEAALAFDDATYREAAVRNAGFLLNTMRPDGRLLRTWKREGDQGRARLNGYLEDYAFLADGLLALYQATFIERYLRASIELADQMIDLFWDDEAQGFYDTGRDHETLITRPRDLFDNATPAGSSVAADVLLRLALICDRPEYEQRAVTCLRAVAPVIDRAVTAFGRTLAALDFYLSTPQELAIVWPEVSSAEAARPFVDLLRATYAPNLLLIGGAAGQVDNASMLLDDREALGGAPTAYLCEKYVCQAPTTQAEELRQQLAAVTI
jgi:uncharacterized protein YyaL (SSP411 family)